MSEHDERAKIGAPLLDQHEFDPSLARIGELEATIATQRAEIDQLEDVNRRMNETIVALMQAGPEPILNVRHGHAKAIVEAAEQLSAGKALDTMALLLNAIVWWASRYEGCSELLACASRALARAHEDAARYNATRSRS